MYSPALSLTDPAGSSAIADGVAWIEGAALGTVATTVAVIAVAAIGLLMLSGRLELRRGVTVVIGCFLLFGASGIAAALAGLTGAERQRSQPAAPDPEPLSSRLPSSAPPPSAHDPYAGASVPMRR
jgi:type IV secretory pathway VirB2 component (pilin)